MEFDEIIVKESPGLCRCCLSEGCYKDLGTEYSWMNENEVYADMLLECFDISISQHNEGPNGPNRLICEVCITRLRDACNFKKQVMDSEKKFIDMIGRGEFRPKVLIYQTQMKAEGVEAETNDEAEIEYLEDDMELGDDEFLKSAENPEATVSEGITVTTLPVKNKRGRPKKNATAVKPEKKAKISQVEEKPRSSKAVIKGDSKRAVNQDIRCKDENTEDPPTAVSKDISAKERLNIMRHNVVQVLLNSTVMPFRWLKSSYRCFYCYDIFSEPKDLKNHNEMVHVNNDEEIYKSMKTYWEPTVFIDISNMSCKLCPEIITDFFSLIDHLMFVHDMPFNKDVGICMNPFKLYNISAACVLCDKVYSTFGHLLVHTNRDHKGCSQLLCDICGQHFRNIQNLRDHNNKEHGGKEIVCSLCGEKINGINRMRTHMQNSHNKRYKCFICTDLFDTHYKRALHMMTVHKKREEIKCQLCPKTFVFRSTMMRHLRERHMQEKNAVCTVCGWKCFGDHRLQLHMMSHSNVRNFKCTSCDKAFKTKKTMRRHYANIHEKVLKIDGAPNIVE